MIRWEPSRDVSASRGHITDCHLTASGCPRHLVLRNIMIANVCNQLSSIEHLTTSGSKYKYNSNIEYHALRYNALHADRILYLSCTFRPFIPFFHEAREWNPCLLPGAAIVNIIRLLSFFPQICDFIRGSTLGCRSTCLLSAPPRQVTGR